MSTFSDKKLHDLMEELIATTSHGDAIAIAQDIKDEIEKSPEWKLQQHLNTYKIDLDTALLGVGNSSDDYEVQKQINFRHANPRFDVNINISRLEMAKCLNSGKNASTIANCFRMVVEELEITSKSNIGKVAVIVQ